MKKPVIFFVIAAAASFSIIPAFYAHAAIGCAAAAVFTACLALGIRSLAAARAREDQSESPGAPVAAEVFLPMCEFDKTGKIHWKNKAFAGALDAENFIGLFPMFNMERPKRVQTQVYNNRQYEIQAMPLASNRGHYLACLVDITERERLKAAAANLLSAICILNVDNYEELGAGTQFQRSAILAQFEKQLQEWADGADAFLRRYDRDRYVIFMDRERLYDLKRTKFPLLAMAHDIPTGGGIPLSLTIAAGTSATIRQSGEYAKQALDLALGRGGDQAVVKDDSGFSFYGGKSQTVEKVSRVKIRTFSRALSRLIEASDAVFLMGHIMPDLDCMGSALGLYRMAVSSERPAYIVLNRPNVTIERLVEELMAQDEYRNVLLKPEDALGCMTSNSVLIVFDTQRKSSTMEPALFDKTRNIVLIDHHRRGLNSIEDAMLQCVEPYASSACELVTEIAQYYGDKCRPRPLECSALLAGITVDTRSFSFNTGVRTFDAASFLRRNGADIASIKRLSQDDMATYADRALVVQSAQNVTESIVLALCPPEMKNAPLIAAQAADTLASIRGIKAAFVAGTGKEFVTVSGRSSGEINVQLILEKLGGGGHMTSAGAQLAGVSLEKADELIKNAINDYLKEVENK